MTRPLRIGRGAKYGAKPTVYAGVRYHSTREADHAAILDVSRCISRPSERVVDVRRQVRFPLEVNGVRVGVWVPDFVVLYADGREEIHEVKGYMNPKDPVTRLWRLKVALFRALNPELPVRIIGRSQEKKTPPAKASDRGRAVRRS